jgi:TusA-related sulfurtransferase
MASVVISAAPAELLAAPIPAGDCCAVDARGLLCPQPIVRLSQAMRSRPELPQFLLECTDPGTVPDLLRWARPWGHTVVALRITHQTPYPLYQFWVRANPKAGNV